ncbi:MAG: exodeoxyribonuclease III [Anaerolineaceae bacterium]|nr:exodeoxyribonuclease III [Anaerolineaceae bacterium]
MKITTFNVNGLRAILNKGLLNWLENNRPDVLCLQEIKSRPEQIAEEVRQLGYPYTIWNPAERPGYSGVATFLIEYSQENQKGLGISEFDNEGRVIWTRHDNFRLYNIYFPNGQRSQERVAYKLDFYARLLEQCDQLHAAGENIIITGDFNTAHNEIDLAHPKENSTTSGFLPEERVWIDHYLEHGFVDVYRYIYPDRVQYTWWSYITRARERNIGWRIDYFMVSKTLIDRISDIIIHEEVMGSDHCPVSLILK